MTEAVFVQRNSQTWKAMETALRDRTKSFEAVERRMVLYREVSGHLNYVRTHFSGSSLCQYLDRLTAEAHAAIYARNGTRRAGFLLRRVPRALYEHWRYIAASALIFFLAAAVALTVSLANPSYTAVFLPEGYKDITASDLRMSEEDLDAENSRAIVMSNSIMVNNIRVALLAFALGITLGIGTVYLLVFNGFMLGALASFAVQGGTTVFFLSLILPHGVWELIAIFISGATGLRIGLSLFRPGPYSRGGALLAAARASLPMMAAVVIMLVVAGIIEGFITPERIPAWIKLSFAGVTLIPFVVYFLWGRTVSIGASHKPKDTGVPID